MKIAAWLFLALLPLFLFVKLQPVFGLDIENNSLVSIDSGRLRWGMDSLIERGVMPTTLVFLILLPLVATMVSILHYVVGISGYGSYTPTMMAVGFLATGIFGGLFLFGLILVTLIFSSWLLKKLKIHYWPARSVSLVLVSVVVVLVMLVASELRLVDLSGVSIFPILFMIVLAEEFVKTQLTKSKGRARELLFGTLLLACIGAMVMSLPVVQLTVLYYPEIVVLFVLVLNIVVGRYSGMRLFEIKRFSSAIRNK